MCQTEDQESNTLSGATATATYEETTASAEVEVVTPNILDAYFEMDGIDRDNTSFYRKIDYSSISNRIYLYAETNSSLDGEEIIFRLKENTNYLLRDPEARLNVWVENGDDIDESDVSEISATVGSEGRGSNMKYFARAGVRIWCTDQNDNNTWVNALGEHSAQFILEVKEPDIDTYQPFADNDIEIKNVSRAPWVQWAIDEAIYAGGIDETEELLNTRIMEYFEYVGASAKGRGDQNNTNADGRRDAAAWCAAFVNNALGKSNQIYANSIHSQFKGPFKILHENDGDDIENSDLKFGSAVIYKDGGGRTTGHVTFLYGRCQASGSLICLGGNQSGTTRFAVYDYHQPWRARSRVTKWLCLPKSYFITPIDDFTENDIYDTSTDWEINYLEVLKSNDPEEFEDEIAAIEAKHDVLGGTDISNDLKDKIIAYNLNKTILGFDLISDGPSTVGDGPSTTGDGPSTIWGGPSTIGDGPFT